MFRQPQPVRPFLVRHRIVLRSEADGIQKSAEIAAGLLRHVLKEVEVRPLRRPRLCIPDIPDGRPCVGNCHLAHEHRVVAVRSDHSLLQPQVGGGRHPPHVPRTRLAREIRRGGWELGCQRDVERPVRAQQVDGAAGEGLRAGRQPADAGGPALALPGQELGRALVLAHGERAVAADERHQPIVPQLEASLPGIRQPRQWMQLVARQPRCAWLPATSARCRTRRGRGLAVDPAGRLPHCAVQPRAAAAAATTASPAL